MRSNLFTQLGRSTIDSTIELGRAGVLIFRTIFGPMPWQIFINQLYMVGVLSIVIIAVSGLFIGLVLGLQGYYTLSKFGASDALGQLLALSITRELGPVVTALLFAGRAGSSLTSEIGLMKATEQLDAMRVMGVDPLRRIIAPRFWAGLISMPILSVIFSAIAIVGGYWVGVSLLGAGAGAFWGNMQASVVFQQDVINGIIKSLCFGFVVTWIAVYQGLGCQPTSEGIAKATTRTVVYASLAVLGLDFVLTMVMFR